MINTSDPPPYDPPLFLRVTDTSSSCHSKNLFSASVIVFFSSTIYLSNKHTRDIAHIHPLTSECLRRPPVMVWLYKSRPITLSIFVSFFYHDGNPPPSHDCGRSFFFPPNPSCGCAVKVQESVSCPASHFLFFAVALFCLPLHRVPLK